MMMPFEERGYIRRPVRSFRHPNPRERALDLAGRYREAAGTSLGLADDGAVHDPDPCFEGMRLFYTRNARVLAWKGRMLAKWMDWTPEQRRQARGHLAALKAGKA